MKCVFFCLFPGKFISGIPTAEWLALTAFPLHFISQGLFIFLIYGVHDREVSLLRVSQGWQSEWEKWQVSYLDNWGTKLAFHTSVLLPFMLGLAYMHPSLPLNTDTRNKGTASFLIGIDWYFTTALSCWILSPSFEWSVTVLVVECLHVVAWMQKNTNISYLEMLIKYCLLSFQAGSERPVRNC